MNNQCASKKTERKACMQKQKRATRRRLPEHTEGVKRVKDGLEQEEQKVRSMHRWRDVKVHKEKQG